MADKIIITSEEDLARVANEAYYILRNYTEANIIFRREFGSENKARVDRWQKKAIAFLKDPTGTNLNACLAEKEKLIRFKKTEE